MVNKELELKIFETRLKEIVLFVKEYKFAEKRRWRFDYAIPDYKIAIEIEGGAWKYGRHNRASGFIKDMEKYNNAVVLGWYVLRFTYDDLKKKETYFLIQNLVAKEGLKYFEKNKQKP